MSENAGVLQKVVMSCVETVKPERQKIINEIKAYRKAHPQWSTDELADNWADRICWLFASEGAATALPGAIPGFGTVAQIGIESVAISADLLYMLRCMAGMVQGISLIYQKKTKTTLQMNL